MKMPDKNTDNKEIKVAIIGVVGAVLTAIVVNWGQYIFNPPSNPSARVNPKAPVVSVDSPTIRDNGDVVSNPSGKEENSTAGLSMNTATEKMLVPATPDADKRVADTKQKLQTIQDTSPDFKDAKKEGEPMGSVKSGSQCGPSILTSVAVVELKALAAKGCHLAEFRLGTIYLYGLSDIKANKAEAFDWMKKAAEGNVAGAQHNLGVMYQDGFGVKKDLQMAWPWYQKAARQGRIDSQNILKKANKTW